MKPFQLDKVLDHRKRLEGIAANRLSEAKRQVSLIKQKLFEADSDLNSLIKKTEELQSSPISILDLINYEDQILHQKKNIAAIKKKLQEKDKTLKLEHEHLIEKSRDRQILQSLKEKQNRSWKQYLDKKEVSMLDEIAIVRHDVER